jgi:hypothetical protein
MRHIDDQLSSGFDDPKYFVEKFSVRVDMLKKIDNDHPVKFVIAKLCSAAIDLEHLVADQVSDRADRLFIEIGALPTPPSLP